MKVYEYRQVVVSEREVSAEATGRLLSRQGLDGFRLSCVLPITRQARIDDEARSPALLYVFEREGDDEARRAGA